MFLVEDNPVDLVLTLRAFKTDPVVRRVPVVMLSTSQEVSDVNIAYDNGANSYIVKPVGFDDFMAVAQRIERYWCGDNLPPAPPLLGRASAHEEHTYRMPS
ncbi:MAG: hypothetical protein Q8K34_18185 [Hydrogenophaga sp.]|jgi:hypothetical protein|nr:hypothetical protein [Hydrogenophaga sp.]MDP3925157.1 hypothetical protein [Hydrogenophaga sp.]